MELKDQVASLELSKRLKELGAKQESAFYFETIVNEEGDKSVTNLRFGKFYDDTANKKHVSYIAAFTVAELGLMIPWRVYGYNVQWQKLENDFDISYFVESHDERSDYNMNVSDKNEANCRAEFLIHLIENEIVKTEEGGGA